MPIPSAMLQIVKDLLLFTPADVQLDSLVTAKWDQQRDTLCREFDLFAYTTTISTTAGKSIYTAPPGTTRILSVLYDGVALGYTDRGMLDLRDQYWESAASGIPEFWVDNAVPGEVDTPPPAITPREFLIHPAPSGALAGNDRLQLIGEFLQATVPVWIEPILLYRTVGHLAAENPNLVQPEKGEWFLQLAEVWQ